MILKTLGYNLKKSHRSSNGIFLPIATTAFLEHYDRYETQGRPFMFSVDETSFGRNRHNLSGYLQSS